MKRVDKQTVPIVCALALAAGLPLVAGRWLYASDNCKWKCIRNGAASCPVVPSTTTYIINGWISDSGCPELDPKPTKYKCERWYLGPMETCEEVSKNCNDHHNRTYTHCFRDPPGPLVCVTWEGTCPGTYPNTCQETTP